MAPATVRILRLNVTRRIKHKTSERQSLPGAADLTARQLREWSEATGPRRNAVSFPDAGSFVTDDLRDVLEQVYREDLALDAAARRT
jgi:hypothetical protein